MTANVSGYRRISDGFKLGVAGFVLLALMVLCLIVLFAGGIITESSDAFGIVYSVKRIVPIISMALIVNGLVEIDADMDRTDKAKQWFVIYLILMAAAMVAEVFYNIINGRFYNETSLLSIILFILYALITSILGYIVYYISHTALMKVYESTAALYGFEEKLLKRIQRSKLLLKISCFVPALTELAFLIYLCVVVVTKGIAAVERRFVFPVVGILLITLFIRMLNYLLMTGISCRIAREIKEISQ